MRPRVKGKKASEDDKKWLEYGRELLIGSSKACEEAAKTIITLETALLPIYAGAVAFLKFDFNSSSFLAKIAVMLFIFYWSLVSFSIFSYSFLSHIPSI
jgi:hypothetical protein